MITLAAAAPSPSPRTRGRSRRADQILRLLAEYRRLRGVADIIDEQRRASPPQTEAENRDQRKLSDKADNAAMAAMTKISALIQQAAGSCSGVERDSFGMQQTVRCVLANGTLFLAYQPEGQNYEEVLLLPMSDIVLLD